MNRIPLTKDGADKLRKELEHLKSVKRPEIIEAIAEARAHGDLKENAEYHAAKEQQSFTEGRIKELEGSLQGAQIIDPAKLNAAPRVVFGAHVELYDLDSEKTSEYQIVGDLEADINENRISVSSPLARALIGREEGDSITFDAPNGTRNYEITAVSYR